MMPARNLAISSGKKKTGGPPVGGKKKGKKEERKVLKPYFSLPEWGLPVRKKRKKKKRKGRNDSGRLPVPSRRVGLSSLLGGGVRQPEDRWKKKKKKKEKEKGG